MTAPVTLCIELDQVLRHSPSSTAIAHLIAHLGGCANCRSRIAASVMASSHHVAAVLPTSCASCEPHLASYLSVEHDHGSDQAIATYPHVWLHLWTCPTCAEQMLGMRTLVAAEQAGRIPAPPRPSYAPGMPVWHTLLQIPRAALNLVLAPPPAALGATRGSTDDAVTLGAELVGDMIVTLTVNQHPGSSASLVFTSQPALAAPDITIQLGEQQFVVPLMPDGTATLHNLPDVLLHDATGPDIVVRAIATA